MSISRFRARIWPKYLKNLKLRFHFQGQAWDSQLKNAAEEIKDVFGEQRVSQPVGTATAEEAHKASHVQAHRNQSYMLLKPPARLRELLANSRNLYPLFLYNAVEAKHPQGWTASTTSRTKYVQLPTVGVKKVFVKGRYVGNVERWSKIIESLTHVKDHLSKGTPSPFVSRLKIFYNNSIHSLPCP